MIEVLHINPETGTVTLAGGERLETDVTVGADGPGSLARGAISDIQSTKAWKAAFRANIPFVSVVEKKKLREDFSPW